MNGREGRSQIHTENEAGWPTDVVAGFCELGDDLLGSINVANFFTC
jgi:hypothetical protein